MNVRHSIFKASAGTGKTHQVTRLYESLILGRPFPDSDDAVPGRRTGAIFDGSRRIDCRRILMLTFANAAAAEMRMRVVPRVEEALSRATEDAEIQFLWSLLKTLPGAHMSTIHSFAQKLISENAIEARVSPGWQVVEESDALDMFQEVARTRLLAVLDDAASDRPAGLEAELRPCRAGLEAFCDAAGTGKTLAAAHGLITRLRSRGVDLASVDLESLAPVPPAPDPAPFKSLLTDLADAHRKQSDLGSNGNIILSQLEAALPAAIKARKPAALIELAVSLDAAFKGNGWKRNDTVAELKDRARALFSAVAQHPFHARGREILLSFLHFCRLCLADYERAKDEAALLDFDDIVFKALTLVRRHPGCTPPFEVIIVDEAQDNSPIQNQFIQSIRENTHAALILCGDRKQSIYTWRNADPGGMDTLMSRLDDRVDVPLSISFRSQKDLIEWINRMSGHPSVFGDNYQGDALHPQPHAQGTGGPNVEVLLPAWEYSPDLGATYDKPTTARGKKTDSADKPSPRHFITGGELAKLAGQPMDPNPYVAWARDYEQRLSLEARAIARRIFLLCSPAAPAVWRPRHMWDATTQRWQPTDTRRYRYRDILILLRTTTHQAVFEAALRELGIQYTTGGKGQGFYFRPETRDIGALLRWLAFPRDYTALAAVARSPFIALSDSAMAILARDEAGGLNGPALAGALSAPPERTAFFASRLAAMNLKADSHAYLRGVTLLRRLQALTGRLNAVELVRIAIQASGYDAILAGSFHGAQRLANMRKLLSTIHDMERRHNLNLQDLVSWLSDQIDATSEPDAVVFDPADDAVRISTVHSAKGLSSPVVIIPKLDQKADAGHGPGDAFMVHGEIDSPAVAANLKLTGDNWQTDSFPTVDFETAKNEEKERRLQESRRLFYVAITRPRDLLILSGPNPSKNEDGWRKWVNEHLNDAIRSGDSINRLIRPVSFEQIAEDFGRLSATESSGEPAPTARHIQAATASIVFPDQPEEYRLPVTTLVKVPGDATDTETLMEYRRTTLVGLAPAWRSARRTDDEPASLLNYAEWGTLGHAVLESFHFTNARSVSARVHEALVHLGADATALRHVETRVTRAATFLCKQLAGVPHDCIIREMPFCARFEHDGAAAIVDGKIDLMYFNAGKWKIVDYKFTNAGADDLLAKYALQLQIYADAAFDPLRDRQRSPRFETPHGDGSLDLTILGVAESEVIPVTVEPAADTAARIIAAARLLRHEQG